MGDVTCLQCNEEMKYNPHHKRDSYNESVYKCPKCGIEILVYIDRD